MAERTYTMSKKELDRLELVEHVVSKRLTQDQAGRSLCISTRQVRRLVFRYRREGKIGLISRRRGRPANNRLAREICDQAIALVRKNYHDFGPTFASEKLEQLHGLRISRETLRKLMISEEIWKVRRKKQKRVFQMRDRRSRFGELVQIDGSPHDWFEGRSEPCTLLVFIDDATSTLLYLRFVRAETTEAYMEGLQSYLQSYGRPASFYSDRHSIFRINTEEPISGNGLTQFGRALETLDIEGIHAHTPQAKGRVERSNQTLQDRLIKEMRLRKISNIAEGNEFLGEYMQAHNERFAVVAHSAENAHRKVLHSEREIELILANQKQRKLSKNLICQYENTIYQISSPRQKYTLRNAQVTVCELSSGEVAILHKGKELNYTAFQKGTRPSALEDEKSINNRVDAACKAQSRRKKWTPKADHPWRKAFTSSNNPANKRTQTSKPRTTQAQKSRKKRELANVK